MHRLRRACLVLALSGGGCTPAAAVDLAAPAGAPAASAPQLTIGEVHVYALDWQTEASRTHGHAGVSGGLSLRGELAATAIEHGPEGTRVAVWFQSLSTHELLVQDQPVTLDPAALIGPRAELLVGADGDVRRAFFAADSSPIFRELMTGVIARLDLRGADVDGGPRQIRGGHGLVEATYHRGTDGVVTRKLARVLRFDTAPGMLVEAEALTARGRIELDEARVPLRIELHDSATLGDERGLLADDRFSLVRERVDRASIAKLVDPVEIDPTEGPDLEAAARELDRQFADGFTMQDLGIMMDTMDGGVLPRTGEISRATALLRGWPERAAELLPRVLAAGDGGRQLAFDALAAAGTPEAQAVMCALLSEPASAEWPERVLLVQRFAFVAAPTRESGELLLALLAVADDAGDVELRQAVLHPMGTVTGRVREPWLAERMHLALVQAAADEDAAIRAAATSGLGNARRVDDLPRLLAAARDVDGRVRVEALAALRTRVTPEATAVLLGALADEDAAVASRALVVLRKYHFEGDADPALVEHARAGTYNPQIDRAMASSLIGSRDTVEVQVALAAIAARTGDAELAGILAGNYSR